jgi:predicted methyltransferase MtxX (methanogen marker protein 4)
VLLAFQAGSGGRRIVGGYGTDAEVDAVLHDPADVAERLTAAGFAVDAVLVRTAVRERHDQGFVLATRAASA